MKRTKASRRRTAIGPDNDRLAVPFSLDFAGPAGGDSGEFRIGGWMNTFQVTSSGRLLDHRSFEAWLKRVRASGGDATVPMLANHGKLGNGDEFRSIGIWDTFKLDPKRGMFWEGYVAQGTPLADQARVLLEQRVLRQLSVRVSGTTTVRYVNQASSDLPPEIKAAVEASGLSEVALYQNWSPMEGSIVDVADDVAARIAASADGGDARSFSAIRERLDDLEGRFGRLSRVSGQVDVAALIEGVEERLEEALERFSDALSDPAPFGAWSDPDDAPDDDFDEFAADGGDDDDKAIEAALGAIQRLRGRRRETSAAQPATPAPSVPLGGFPPMRRRRR